MDESNKLSKSLKSTLTDTDFQDLSVSVAETIMDSVTQDGLVKDIPIIWDNCEYWKNNLECQGKTLCQKTNSFPD
ncbi:MAG: hypothetical protein QM734_07890 [Cyclobacteriaceae bacterium]